MPNGLLDALAPDPRRTNFPAVNTITIAGQTMPGMWKLKSATKAFGWDQRKGYGLSGAVSVPTGDELVVATFTVTIGTSADFAIFREVRKALFKFCVFTVPGTVTSKAMGIYHPELAALGVDAVVLKSITPMVNDDTGLWTCDVEFLQYRKPRDAPPKPSTKIPDVVAPQPTAKDAQEVELQGLKGVQAGLATQLASLRGR